MTRLLRGKARTEAVEGENLRSCLSTANSPTRRVSGTTGRLGKRPVGCGTAVAYRGTGRRRGLRDPCR
jgi:hypothetical protein